MKVKHKDHMMNALDDFWASDYKVPTHKLDTPRLKSSEDDAYDALWGRGQFMKNVRTIDSSKGSRYIKDVQPVQVRQQVQYQESPQQVITQQQRYDLAKDAQKQRFEIYKQKLKYQQMMASRSNTGVKKTNAFLGGVVKGITKLAVERAKDTDAYRSYEDKEIDKKLERSLTRKERTQAIKDKRKEKYEPAFVGGKKRKYYTEVPIDKVER